MIILAPLFYGPDVLLEVTGQYYEQLYCVPIYGDFKGKHFSINENLVQKYLGETLAEAKEQYPEYFV